MKYGYLIEQKDISYDEYLKIVGKMLETGTVAFYDNCVKKGVEVLTQLNDENQRKRVVSASYCADRKFTDSKLTQSSKKLPIFMTIANLIVNYPEKTEKLNDNELVLLSFFTSFVDPVVLGEHLGLVSDKEILKNVLEKDATSISQLDILEVVSNKFSKQYNSAENEFVANTIKNDAIGLIKNNTVDEIKAMKPDSMKLYQALYEHSDKGSK